MAANKEVLWEYTSTEFTMAQMNFMGKLGWEVMFLSPKGTHVYYKKVRK